MKKTDKYILLGIVILIILASSIIYIPRLFNKNTSLSTAIITKNGVQIEKIDLSKVDQPYEFVVESDNGGSNTIYVEKNKIKFIKANCPDQLCVKTGFLSHSNDISVCLPHGIFIEIESDSTKDIDSLSY